MNLADSPLPEDANELREFALKLQQRLVHKEEFIDQLLEQLRLKRHREFGPSSEQNPAQPSLFNEAETIAAEEAAVLEASVLNSADAVKAEKAPSARGGRRALPAELPRLDVVHELSEHDRRCACGCQLSEIGEDISEQLDIIPAKVRVLRHIRKKYICKQCESAPTTAALPQQPIPKSNASPSLLAYIVIAKFLDGLPLHRLEAILQRAGVDLPRQTSARWMIQAAALLQPLHNLLRDQLLSGHLIHYDETTVQVLKEPDKPPTSLSYMWVAAGGSKDRPVVLFDYRSSRSGQVPLELLSGFQGYLMTDGYEGYSAVATLEGIEHLCCMAHARRKFVEAKKAQPKTKGPAKTSKADVAINLINKLYGIESKIKDSDTNTRFTVRQQESAAVLDQLRKWLDKTIDAVLPSGKLGEALSYLNKYWSKLTRYIERADLPIDNNTVENAIRPFAVGRKAWLFSDTPAGAHASSVLYSIIETAKKSGLEPYAYLKHLFRQLPAATTVEAFESLLPWNIDRNAIITEWLD